MGSINVAYGLCTQSAASASAWDNLYVILIHRGFRTIEHYTFFKFELYVANPAAVIHEEKANTPEDTAGMKTVLLQRFCHTHVETLNKHCLLNRPTSRLAFIRRNTTPNHG